MKVVIDCNVFVSAALCKGVCREVIKIVIENHDIYFSQKIIDEYLDVASRPKFQKIQMFETIWQILKQVAFVIEPANQSFGLIDEDDEIYIATALSANADALIT